jgi:membrane protease YdiL (CAAX protease family)
MSTTVGHPALAPEPRRREPMPVHAEPREFRDPPPGFGRYPWWTSLAALAIGLVLVAGPFVLLNHVRIPFKATIGEGLFIGVLLAVSVALMSRTRGRPRLSELGLRSTPSRAAVGWVLVARFTFGIVSAIYVSAVHGVTPNAPVSPIAHPSTVKAIDLILAVVVLAPLGEELFFRGFMYASLRGRVPVFWAALTSAALFGAVHPIYGVTAWNLVPVLAMAGFAMCLLYERTGSLWPAIAFHFVMNVGVVYIVTASVEATLIPVAAAALVFLFAPWRVFRRQPAESSRSMARAQSRAASATVE